MISIKDIAELAGVSISTVSRVINEKSYVREEKRKRVLEVIDETGFVPNRAARDIVLKRTSKVGIFLPETFNQFQRQLFSEIAHNLETLRYHTNFFFVSEDEKGEQNNLLKLKSERMDGVIILSEIELPAFRNHLIENNIPTVIVTFENERWKNCTSIHIDEEAAAYTVVDYLIKQGHKDIALIGGKLTSFATQRESGYKKALKNANIDYLEELTVYADAYNIAEGIIKTKELLNRNVKFSSVFAITDELAIGCIRQLKDSSFSIPRDVSVVGIDDIEISSYISPRLTTIEQPLKDMGKMAVEKIHDLISNGVVKEQNFALPFALIERESVSKKV